MSEHEEEELDYEEEPECEPPVSVNEPKPARPDHEKETPDSVELPTSPP
jgi:hypothetical protein